MLVKLHITACLCLYYPFKLKLKILEEVKEENMSSIDGKTVRGSFDKFSDQDAIHILSAFLIEDKLILGHLSVNDDKTNEIPKFIELLEELGLEDVIIGADALHCQKKV